MRKAKRPRTKRAFTLIELLITVGIIGILSTVLFLTIGPDVIEKAKIASATYSQRQLQKSVQFYFSAMGFYPPDTSRGWDPGFARALPYNIDTGQDCSINPSDCPACPNCPADWITQVQSKWQGPYISSWPQSTPWDGKYDYNYWPSVSERYGCMVPAGIYIGVQGDYSGSNIIPADAEQEMLNKNLDADGCLNGESQMLLLKL